MSTTHVLSRSLAVTAAACLVAGILTTTPAFAADPSAPPSAPTVVDNDKGGAGQGPYAAPALLAAGPRITRSEVINRAASWVGQGLKYTHTGETYQGYRKDCSGYASMAWKLSTYMGGLDTTSFVPTGVASWIGKEELKPGDALLNDAAGYSGHIALFAGWTDSSHSSYDAYEFTGDGVHHRTIPYPYFPGHGTFKPVRNNSIVEDSGDQPVAGNWDGGAAGNVGVWRPSTGQFHLRFGDGSLHVIDWGQAGDIPVSGNFDGTGPDDLGVWRPSTGQFHLRFGDGSLHVIDWGQAGDVPVAGNWDGGAATNVGIWRPSTGQFHLRFGDGSLHVIDWGQAGDIPVSGNFDGGPAANLGIFRPSTGQFHLRFGDGSLHVIDWGQAGDIPVSANFDGVGPDNIGIWRPSTGQFHLRNDDGSLVVLDWGQPR